MMEKNKFTDFLEVIAECDIQHKEDYATFMAVIKEHCLDKGVTEYEEIKDTWLRFKANLQDVAKHIHEIGNNL